MTDKFIPISQVTERCALSKVEIYRRIKAGTFPKPIALGRFKVVWLESELSAWMADRVAARASDEEAARRHARAMKAVAGRGA